jgi:hypothetical protein
MLEKQTKILEYTQLLDGSIIIKKITEILENGVVIASIINRETVNDIDAHVDIPYKIKPHLKAIASAIKEDANKEDLQSPSPI